MPIRSSTLVFADFCWPTATRLSSSPADWGTEHLFDLEWLLGPLSVDDFENGIWQRRSALIASHPAEVMQRLFDFRELESVLEYGQPRPPSIRLASSRVDRQVDVPFNRNGRLDMDRIRRYFSEGHTIIVNSVHDFSAPVATLVQNMQERMSFAVEANAYLTPPAAQGFKPHYDTHDVIVAHVAGEKQWRVYGPEAACPLNELTNGDPFRREQLPEPERFTLRAGDVLYIPRGWIHEAESDEQTALHLTLGIHVTAGRDLVSSALDALCRIHPEFREPLPIGFLRRPTDVETLSNLLRKLSDLLQAEGSAAAALDAIEDEFVHRGRSGGDGQLVASAEALRHIDPATALVRRRHLPARVVETGAGVALQFSQSLIEGPPIYRSAMEFVLMSEDAFTVGELPALDTERQIAFARSLVRDGLVRLA